MTTTTNNSNNNTTVSIFDGCDESCGWIAAIICVIAFGTFGVPLKTGTPPGIEVHALVMQTYKTTVCFLTCWFVVLAGERIQFTYWGIASGLFWVPGAACGIYGIRNAGLAVAVGTWSSITVLTSFIFGIIIFQERVKNIIHTIYAFLLLIIGLIGMAKYSSTTPATAPAKGTVPQASSSNNIITPTKRHNLMPISLRRPSSPGSTTTLSAKSPTILPKRSISASERKHVHTDTAGTASSSIMTESSASSSASYHNNNEEKVVTTKKPTSSKMQPFEFEPLIMSDDDDGEDAIMMKGSSSTTNVVKTTVVNTDDEKLYNKNNDVFHICYNIFLTRRQMGIIGAVINGGWGGLNLIPLHYAMIYDNLSGAGYLISYACGSMIVNICIWIIFILYYYIYKTNYNWYETIELLPKFHLQHLLIPGFTAGLLYSIGNFTSILAVTYLGQGTGFSFCMMQLFVSGLWGVFYFHEIRGYYIIFKWFTSAAIAVTGIIWLSYEHEGQNLGH